jgi:hypothetical protein
MIFGLEQVGKFIHPLRNHEEITYCTARFEEPSLVAHRPGEKTGR